MCTIPGLWHYGISEMNPVIVRSPVKDSRGFIFDSLDVLSSLFSLITHTELHMSTHQKNAATNMERYLVPMSTFLFPETVNPSTKIH
jgi:hypothetical protein